MHCCTCDKPLSQCTCPDLQERLEHLVKCDIFFTPKQWEALKKQAALNKEQQTRSE